MNIYLIGYRCTGKTRVGKALAEKMALQFIDADDFLVNQEKMAISDLVSTFGWPVFREKEARVILQLSQKTDLVVATGGGVVLRPENIGHMKKNGGRIVWLTASADTILARMAADTRTPETRPPLTDKKIADEVAQTLKERTPLYEQAMDVAIDTENKSIDAVVQEIMDKI